MSHAPRSRKGTERQRREAVDHIRSEMGRRMVIFDQRRRNSHDGDPERLDNAEGMIWNVLENRYGYSEHPLISEIAADFGVNDELTRLIILGKRKPSKAFLDAVGYERVTLYRRKPQDPTNDRK